MTAVTAMELGLRGCQVCTLVSRAGAIEAVTCPRCGVRLHARKPDSLRRTSAFLMAAVLLFVPANLMPMMSTTTLLGTRTDTLASGVWSLWRSGSRLLAALIFLASIVVPTLKVAALAVLVSSSALRARWGRTGRTRLYRVVEFIGRWSMLDLFVMALLATLVRTSTAGVVIEPGAVPFAAVVVLTMLASASFDPRLIWQRANGRDDGQGERRGE